MIIKGLLFLAGHTARSQAYAQSMVHHNIAPEHVLLFGPESGKLPGQGLIVDNCALEGVAFCPNLNEPIAVTCKKNKWPTTRLETSNVNDFDILQILENQKFRFVIFSGYGGQIVAPELLELSQFLHIHPGWLPEYRGSTTVYYSWLKEGICGATAILLEPEIDTGPIIARKRFPTPSPGIDVDYLYDPAIRADLLIDVLNRFLKTGKLPKGKLQKSEYPTYFVVHPILKHLALLSKDTIK